MKRNRILFWSNIEEVCRDANLDQKEMAELLTQWYADNDPNPITVVYDDGKLNPKEG